MALPRKLEDCVVIRWLHKVSKRKKEIEGRKSSKWKLNVCLGNVFLEKIVFESISFFFQNKLWNVLNLFVFFIFLNIS